jgi:foldase protein PrsA
MKSMRLALAVSVCVLVVAAAVGLSGCADNKNTAVKVNGQAIKTTDLDAQLNQLKKQYPQMFTGADAEGRLLDYKQRILESLINQSLIEQAAKERGVVISDAEVQKQIDSLKSGFAKPALFEQALKSSGMTLDQLKSEIKNQLVTQKLVESLSANQKVSDADIQAYYNKNKARFFRKPAKRSSHILFKSTDTATADKVLKMLQAGTIKFAAAAKKYSIDVATASKGGDLGWPTTPLLPEYQTALDALKKGQMSDVVQTTSGLNIILVTDERGGAQQPLSEVKSQIEQTLIQQARSNAYQQFLNDLRKKAKIEYVESDLNPAAKPSSTATKSK